MKFDFNNNDIELLSLALSYAIANVDELSEALDKDINVDDLKTLLVAIDPTAY